jgi:type IV secretory pathway TraG/TraD family ATPase VirD4
VSDLDTLDLASRLIGEEEIDRDSATTDDTGRRSSTTSTQWRRLLPPESACRLRDGDAVLLYGNLPPTRVRLRPWYTDRHLKRRAAQPLAPLPPSEPTPAAAPAVVRPSPGPSPDDGAVVSIEDAARARRRNRGGAPT